MASGAILCGRTLESEGEGTTDFSVFTAAVAAVGLEADALCGRSEVDVETGAVVVAVVVPTGACELDLEGAAMLDFLAAGVG